MSLAAEPETIHATSIALDGAGILIRGASGSGKSALALELISRGAALISDDLTRVELGDEGWPMLATTGRMTGVIEARHVGLLRVPHEARAPLRLVVDMDTPETDRLPPERRIVILGVQSEALHRIDSPHFPASILCLVKGGRAA